MKLLLRLMFVSFLAISTFSTSFILPTGSAWADDGGGDGDGGGGDGGDGGGGDSDSDGGDDGDSDSNGGDVGADRGNISGSFSGRDNHRDYGETSQRSRSGKFESLSSIIGKFKKLGKGRFLDAVIIKRKGVAFYKVTFIRPNGKVGLMLFLASKKPTGKGRFKATRPIRNFNRSQN